MTDIETRLRQALTPGADDEARADRLVGDVLAQHARARRRAWVPVAASVAAAAGIAAALTLAPWARPAPAPSTASSAAAPTPTLRCAPDGPHLDVAQAQASPSGVRLVVQNATGADLAPTLAGTSPAGMPGLAFTTVAAGARVEQTVDLAPGRTSLTCGEPSGRAVTLTVTDPGHAWAGSVAQAGCPAGALPSWAGGPGRGASAEQAAHAWPTNISPGPEAARPGRTLRRLSAGYPDGTQYWVVDVAGRPNTLLVVTRSGGEWVAGADWRCAGAGN